MSESTAEKVYKCIEYCATSSQAIRSDVRAAAKFLMDSMHNSTKPKCEDCGKRIGIGHIVKMPMAIRSSNLGELPGVSKPIKVVCGKCRKNYETCSEGFGVTDELEWE